MQPLTGHTPPITQHTPPITLPLWTYWEGPRTALVELCLDSLRRHHPALQVLNPTEVVRLGGAEVLERTQGDVIAHRSDLLRWWLMREFGGAWFDADMLFFRPTGLIDDLLAPAFRGQPRAVSYDVAGFVRPKQPCQPEKSLGDQHFAFRPGSGLGEIAYGACLAALAAPHSRYGDTNHRPLEAVCSHASQRVTHVPHRLYHPIPLRNPWRFMVRGSDDEFRQRPGLWPRKHEKPIAVHLGGFVMYAFGHLYAEQLLASSTLLGFYLRQAGKR